MHKIRLAIPTQKQGGLEDVVSDVFGRAKTFSIIDIEDKKMEKVEVVENPAASYKHGAGPIAVKTLIDKGVHTVLAAEFGPGVATLLDQFHVVMVEVKRGTRVIEVVKQFLKESDCE